MNRLWFCVLLIHHLTVLHSQEFMCDGSAFVAVTNNQNGSSLYQIKSDFTTEQLPLENDLNRHLTCLGYNVKDKLLYALDFNSYELLKINSLGKIEVLGIPDNLDTTFLYYAGGMTPDGRRLVVFARNPQTNLDERVYSIRVNDAPDYYAGFFSVIADIPVALSDIAVDPIVGTTYGFDSYNGQIVETDRTGLTSGNNRKIEQVPEEFGTMFFDRNGQLFGFGSSGKGGSHTSLYEISKTNGETQLRESLFTGFDSDGCSCPYTITIEKTILPDVITPCQEVLIHYRIINHAGIGQVSTRLYDNLPANYSIRDVEMENIFLINNFTELGGSIVDIDRWTLTLGDNIVSVKAIVTQGENVTDGTRAELKNLAYALGDSILSDDPTTLRPNDPTLLEVIDPDKLELENYITYSCRGDTAWIKMPLKGQYEWNTGSISNELGITQDGVYSVSIQSDCFSYQDTIDFIYEPPVYNLDIGDTIFLKLGDNYSLLPMTNIPDVTTYTWSSDPVLELNCASCESAELIATESATIFLLAVDQTGCEFIDDLVVIVDEQKQVYTPTSFSPNGDLLNDKFTLFGTAGIIRNLKIYDRWGAEIIHLENIPMNNEDLGWDGLIDQKSASTGTYLWTAELEFPDGENRRFSGQILLFR